MPLDASMLDGLPDPVFLVDQSLVIVDSNRAARNLLGPYALGNKLDKSLDNADVASAIEASLSGMPGSRQEVFFSIPHCAKLRIYRLAAT